MNGSDQVIESVLRTALRDAADQIDVRPTTPTATVDDLVARRRVTRRAPTVLAIAAGLVVALVVGGSLILSASRDPSSLKTRGAPGGCAGKAYVLDGVDGTVSAITIATGEVSMPIAVSKRKIGGPTSGVAITPDGTHAYVTDGDHNTVLVIDTAAGAVSDTIPVGYGPFDVAVTPDGQRAYVTNRADGTVSVIDTATGAVLATIPVGLGPSVLAITPDGKHAYVTTSGDTVSVIDTARGVVSARIDIGWGTSGVAITPDGRHAYVAGTGFHYDMSAPPPVPLPTHGMVSVIDTARGVVSATIPVGSNPGGVAITPDGTHAYVVDHTAGGGTVSVIDTATGAVSAIITLGKKRDPQAVAITPDGKYAYVTGPDEYSYLPGREDPAPDPLPIHGSVSVIDTATGVVSATIPVGKDPGGVAMCPS
jgi:YVTN family beta-propeller protein